MKAKLKKFKTKELLSNNSKKTYAEKEIIYYLDENKLVQKQVFTPHLLCDLHKARRDNSFNIKSTGLTILNIKNDINHGIYIEVSYEK